MASQVHLNNPPISEALVDVRVPPVSLDGVKDILQARLLSTYPVSEESQGVLFQATIGPGSSHGAGSRTLGVIGYWFKTEDGSRIAQFRGDGLTFNILKRYPGWEAVHPEVRRLWGEYVRVLKPQQVLRVGLRFINRLQFPLEGFKFDRYLHLLPGLPEGLPDQVADVFLRVVVPSDDAGRKVILTQRIEPPSSNDCLSVVLDVEAFREASTGLEADNLLGELQQLRTLKNKAFFGSLTEEALEPYR